MGVEEVVPAESGSSQERAAAATDAVQAVADAQPPPPPSYGWVDIDFDNLRWHEHEPGVWTRGLWGNEVFQERRADATGRSEDMITSTLLELPPAYDMRKFIDVFRLTCANVRFNSPLIATAVRRGISRPELMPNIVYVIPKSYADVEEWLQQYLQVEQPSTDEERAQSITQRILALRRRLSNENLDVARRARNLYLVLSGRPEEHAMVGVVSYCAHATSDAFSEAKMLDHQLQRIAQIEQAGVWPLPPSHELHPSNLPWGQEVKNLPLTVHELFDVPVDACNFDEARAAAARLLAGYSLRLDKGREHGLGKAPTSQTRIQLTEEETAAVHAAARAHGWSVTHVVDAARHLAYMHMRREYIESDKPKLETLHVDFLVPLDPRRYISPERHEGTVGCNLTVGFGTAIPLMDAYYVPASKQLGENPKLRASELSEVRALKTVTSKLCEQYTRAQNRITENVQSISAYLYDLMYLTDKFPPMDISPEGFSSVGVVDRLIPLQHTLPGIGTIHVRDWAIGLTMTRHIFSMQFSMHIWTVANRLSLSVVHTDQFSVEYVETFLRTMRNVLLRFSRAWQEDGVVPVNEPTAEPVTEPAAKPAEPAAEHAAQ